MHQGCHRKKKVSSQGRYGEAEDAKRPDSNNKRTRSSSGYTLDLAYNFRLKKFNHKKKHKEIKREM